ncbi:MAG: Omp28-related outer membrane protein [Alistipes sp.]|nr:Omp28-related outer membrane protein [Alistipes sp.]
MRRIYSLFALVALILSACTKTTTDAPQQLSPELSVDVEGVINMGAEGGTVTINYTIANPVEGLALEATTEQDWIGNIAIAESVTLDVDANHTTESRVGVVTLTYGTESVTIGVQQEGATSSGEILFEITSERKMAFNSKGGEGTILYTLKGDDATLLPEITSNREWLTISDIGSSEATFNVERNRTTEKRNAKLTVSYMGSELTIFVDQDAASDEVTLKVDKATVKGGEQVHFTVIYEDEDVTGEATIHANYTNEQVANPYTTDQSGELSFYAKYNGIKSKLCSVTVTPAYAPEFPADANPESYDFNQRMLIVDHTGLGCAYCPGVKQAIHDTQAKAEYKDKFNVVYAYTFNSNEVCYSSAARTLWNYYVGVCSTGDKLTGYPSFTTNYCFNYTGKYQLEQRIDDLWDENPAASIAYAAKIEGDKIVVSASVKSSVSQNYKLSLWVLENDIYANQTAATAEWMHTHSSVMRDAPTGVSNSDISGIDFGYVEAGTTLSRILEFDLFCANQWNRENFSLIAILSAPSEKYNGKYEVVTTSMCDFGSEVGFDYKR